jgi:hypothetical protein
MFGKYHLPKRLSEIIAFVSVSTTLFLYIQTRELSSRLNDIQQPYLSDSLSFPSSSGSKRKSDVSSSIYYSRQLSIERSNLSASELNNTKNAKKDVLFFNRVPKVGSQTTMELLKALSLKNQFKYHKDRTQKVETIKLTYNEEKWLSNLVNYFDAPSVYVKHVCFVNFTQFDIPEPIYVNMVRDPVERVISWYYYVRAPWYFVERKRAFPDLPLPNPNWLRKDYETCVATDDPECRYIPGQTTDFADHRRQTMFFCGMRDDCT